MRNLPSWDLRDEAYYLRRRLTDAEDRLWKRLRGKKLGVKFRRRHVVCGMIPSFYSIKARVAVHVLSPGDPPEWTTLRKELLRTAGITLMVFAEAEVVSATDACVEQIHEAIPKELISKSTLGRPIRAHGGFQAERRRVQLLRESFRALRSHRLESPNERES